ncbi:MAG: hypothetical protein V4754_13780 [Pseudomonadota bacterium]
MQRSDDSPAGGTRPSLLSPAPHGETDRNRILSSLEGSAPGAVKPAPGGGRRLWWSVAGTAGLALLAGALWIGMDSGAPQRAAPVLSSAPVGALPAQLSSAPAAIQDETLSELAGAASQQAEQAPSVSDGKDTLGGNLVTPQPAPQASASVLSDALETPPVLAKAPKPALKDKPHAKPVAAKPAVEPDSDVTLLTALIAHLQGAPTRKATHADLLAELKQCRQLAPDPAEKCVTRVCAGVGKSDSACAEGEKAPAGKAPAPL